jgi:hypothetical protein
MTSSKVKAAAAVSPSTAKKKAGPAKKVTPKKTHRAKK